MMCVNVATATASVVNHHHHHHSWGCCVLLPLAPQMGPNDVMLFGPKVSFFFNVLCYFVKLTYFLDLGLINGTTMAATQKPPQQLSQPPQVSHRHPDPMLRATDHGLGMGTNNYKMVREQTRPNRTTGRWDDKMMGRQDDKMTGRWDDKTTGRQDDKMMGDEGEEAHRMEKGPGDVTDVSWATGKFFFFFSHFILLLLTIF